MAVVIDLFSRPVIGWSLRQAMDEGVAWMLRYSRARLHSTLAPVGPMRFEEDSRASQRR